MRIDVSAPNMQDQNNQSIPSAVPQCIISHAGSSAFSSVMFDLKFTTNIRQFIYTVNFMSMSIISSEKYHQKSCDKSTSLLPSMCTWHFCCHGLNQPSDGQRHGHGSHTTVVAAKGYRTAQPWSVSSICLRIWLWWCIYIYIPPGSLKWRPLLRTFCSTIIYMYILTYGYIWYLYHLANQHGKKKPTFI